VPEDGAAAEAIDEPSGSLEAAVWVMSIGLMAFPRLEPTLARRESG
jgi:hypothetical protein